MNEANQNSSDRLMVKRLIDFGLRRSEPVQWPAIFTQAVSEKGSASISLSYPNGIGYTRIVQLGLCREVKSMMMLRHITRRICHNEVHHGCRLQERRNAERIESRAVLRISVG